MRERFSLKQNEYIRSANHRWNIKVGAVRSGKSFVDVAHMIPSRLRALRDKPGLNVFLGVTRETIERNILEPMRELYGDTVVGNINSKNIASVCGVDVYCLGAEKFTQVAKIQGSSIKYAYGDEIPKWHKDVFHMLQSRLDKPYSCFDGALNPESPGHWLKAFIDREDIDAYVQYYTIFDNPFLSKKFVEDLCKEYAGTVYYDRYILGKWALAEGLIYPMWRDAVVDELPAVAPKRHILSIDYGTMNAFAALDWAEYDSGWTAEREYYYSGRDKGQTKTDEEYAQDLDRFIAPLPKPIKVIIDPSAASFIALLQKRNHQYRVIKADNDVLDGIRETATALQTGKIKVFSGCENWVREVQGYVWDEDAGEDRPVKEADHSCDAMRYFVKTVGVAKPKGKHLSW